MGDFVDHGGGLGSSRPSKWTDQPDVRRRARLFVAANAVDAEDCAELLSILGLEHSPEEVAGWVSTTPNNSAHASARNAHVTPPSPTQRTKPRHP